MMATQSAMKVNRIAASKPAFFLAGASPMRSFSHSDNFMSGSNANYIDYMYA